MPAHRDPSENPTQRRAREDRIAVSVATLERAGLTVDRLDDHLSLVAGRFEWHRATNRWKERGGTGREGYSLLDLIRAAEGR